MPLVVVGGTYIFQNYRIDYYIFSYNSFNSINCLSILMPTAGVDNLEQALKQ